MFKSIVLSPVSYTAPLLGSNTVLTVLEPKFTQKLIDLGFFFYWICGFSKKDSFISLYNIPKDLNIPPMSAKCVLAHSRCHIKWENSKCIIFKRMFK